MDIETIIVQEEYNIIGMILKDESLINEISLKPQHFIDSRNRTTYETMLALKEAGKGINTLSLMHLGKTKSLQMGGKEHIKACINGVVSMTDMALKRSEKAIFDYWTLDKAATAASAFLNEQKKRLDIDDLKQLTREINGLEAETVSDGKSFKDNILERAEYHKQQKATGLSGIDTGYDQLNKITDGWTRGNLIVIGARPSMGKTAFIINSMMNTDESIYNNFFSLEMTEGEIVDRFIASKGKINLMKMKNPNKFFNENEHSRYMQAIGELESVNLKISEERTISNIRAGIRRSMNENPNKKHIAYIDYLTLIRPEQQGSSRHLEVEKMITELKEIAQEFKIPIIVLSQLSRQLEQRNDKRPIMADLRESGAIEQAADVIIFLHREAYYTPTADEKATDVIIAKNRNGTTGILNFEFYRQTNLFKGA